MVHKVSREFSMNASSIFLSLKKALPVRASAFLASLLYILGACQAENLEQGGAVNPVLLAPISGQARQEPPAPPSFAGQFLAARYAQQIQDNAAASSFFSNALRRQFYIHQIEEIFQKHLSSTQSYPLQFLKYDLSKTHWYSLH